MTIDSSTYRLLGTTGLRVSPLTLGAKMFGRIGNPSHEDSIRIIHRALDAGINIIDTAEVYSRGESEEIVGKALRGRRDDVVLATKVHGAMSDDDPRGARSPVAGSRAATAAARSPPTSPAGCSGSPPGTTRRRPRTP
jgi:aryl-alcohol dehydrogenase-like predicted oxidoreductase